MSAQSSDQALLSAYMKTPVDYQRLQETVKAMHPLFEGFVAREQDGVKGTVLAPYMRLGEDPRLDEATAVTLAVALQDFARRFRPDLAKAPERWPVAEIAVGFYPTYVLWYQVSDDPAETQAVLEYRADGEVAAKGFLSDVFTTSIAA